MNKNVKKPKYRDLQGRVFERLTVIRPNGRDNSGGVEWLCLCSCGEETTVRASNLLKNTTKSCGCLQQEWAKAFARQPLRLRKNPPLPVKQVKYRLYQKSAQKRNFLFALTFEFFDKMTSSNCFYCGKPPTTINSKFAKERKEKCNFNGLDRKDSKLGYTEDNVVPCCGPCNFRKGTLDQKQFLEWLSSIFTYRIKTFVDSAN